MPHADHDPAIDDAYDAFRENLPIMLAAVGWKRSDLADALGCSQSYIWQLMSGYRNPSLGTLIRIAQALEIDDFSELVKPR